MGSFVVIQQGTSVYGREARDLRAGAREVGINGARAALETFYHAFNNRSVDVLRGVWAEDALVQLNNPLGGLLRGPVEVVSLYERVFSGPARVWVELYEVIEYVGGDTVTFAGRERGEFRRGHTTLPLTIRTSRVFGYLGPTQGWRQLHHHGSIDDVELLGRYQRAVLGQP